MMIGIVIVAVIAIAIGGFLYKKKQDEQKAEEERLRLIAEEEERKRQIALEEEARRAARKAEIEAGKELYHYLNQSIKTMFYHYRTDQWEDLTDLGPISIQDSQAANRCMDKLTDGSKKLIQDFFACIDFDANLQGQGEIKDSSGLKKVFEEMMLPFFPVYYKEFSSGPRYISFLNQQILKLFTQLSGKKFRLGYKNRYQNGQIAFEWTDDIYRVFNVNGAKLCEASFENGAVKDGFATLHLDEKSMENWEVFQKGNWKNGDLKSEDLEYKYQIVIS